MQGIGDELKVESLLSRREVNPYGPGPIAYGANGNFFVLLGF
jgi:hypothetical protein